MSPLKNDDVVYGTSTFLRYLAKYHGVIISRKELDDRLSGVIKEEIEEEEVEHGIAG